MTFTNATVGHDANGYTYADSTAPFSSICQECHTTAPAPGCCRTWTTRTRRRVRTRARPAATRRLLGLPQARGGVQALRLQRLPRRRHGVYWPDGVGSNRTIYPDRAGRHLAHMTDIGARMGYGAVPASFTGAQQIAICAFCHNDATGVGGGGHYVGGYNRTDAPANVGSFNQMWGAYAADAGRRRRTTRRCTRRTRSPAARAARRGLPQQKLTPAGYEWYGTTTPSACLMCHDDVSTAVAARACRTLRT